MKPYYIVRVSAPAERETFVLAGRRDVRATYDENQRASDAMEEDCAVIGVDTAADADALLAWLTNRYPSNSYMITKSEKAGYREVGPLKYGVFTPEGFMPQ